MNRKKSGQKDKRLGIPRRRGTAPKHQTSKMRRGVRSLVFPLEVVDGWPPYGSECLPFKVVPGGLKLLVPPLYVKKLSVGDVIAATEKDREVRSWEHVRPSNHTTIWLLAIHGDANRDIKRALKRLNALGCLTSHNDDIAVSAVDVPPNVPMQSVDAELASLDPDEIGIAYPSFRHAEAS